MSADLVSSVHLIIMSYLGWRAIKAASDAVTRSAADVAAAVGGQPAKTEHIEVHKWHYIRANGGYEPLAGQAGFIIGQYDYCPTAEVIVDGKKRTLRLVIRDASRDFWSGSGGAFAMESPEYLVEIPCPDVGEDGAVFTVGLTRILSRKISEEAGQEVWLGGGTWVFSVPCDAPQDLPRSWFAAQEAWRKHICGE